ncbi:MAG: leucine-rich repeat domain-containing protein [Thermoguttaceae bacterium]
MKRFSFVIVFCLTLIFSLALIEPMNSLFAADSAADSAAEPFAALKKISGNAISSQTPDGPITSIIITSTDLPENLFELIGQQENLEVLQVANFRDLNDSMIEQISNLSKLKSLTLTNSAITDRAVEIIAASFPDLVELDLSSNTLLTDKAVSEMAKLQKLERLTINYCNFSEFAMLDIATLPNLQVLDIRANMVVGNTGLEFLAELPKLRALKHRSPAVDDFGIVALTKAKNLETLEIQDFTITDASGSHIKKFEKLVNLIIFRCAGFGSNGLLELKGTPLGRLTLRGLPSLDDVGMETFRDLTTLKRLYLHELPSVTDAGMLNLVYLQNLEVLDLWDMPITDKTIDMIVKLPSLKELSIRSTNISDAAVPGLLAAPKLEKLTLKDNAAFTESGNQELKNSKKFKTLVF